MIFRSLLNLALLALGPGGPGGGTKFLKNRLEIACFPYDPEHKVGPCDSSPHGD